MASIHLARAQSTFPWAKLWAVATATGRNLYHWEWTRSLVYWLILSAGTASDFVFIMASFWMSINANVHPMIIQHMTEENARYITYLATTAYVALPIFIVALSCVQTVGHAKRWHSGLWAKFWTMLFGIPSVVFLFMDFVTIGCAVSNVSFEMPMVFVVLRALSAFLFAFGSLIYFFLGKPQERERLAERDALIAGLREEMVAAQESSARERASLLSSFAQESASLLSAGSQEKESLLSTIDAKNDEIESLKSLLSESQRGFLELHRSVQKSDDDALQAYGDECLAWINSGVKSADIGTIASQTGLTTTKINNALKRGDLRGTPQNKSLVLISSLVPWLKTLAEKERNSQS